MRGEPLGLQLRALARLPRDVLWQRGLYRLKTPLYASALYRLTLPNRGAGAIVNVPPDPWPGDAARGAAIAGGELTLAGQTIHQPAPLWNPPGALDGWIEALHGFAWLRDLRAVGGDTGRRTARDLVARWIEDCERWHETGWRPDVLGQRLTSWIACHDFYAASGDALFRSRLLASAGRQACHLARALPAGLTGDRLLVAIKGLAYAGLFLPQGQDWLARAALLLERELGSQILADGGHASRSPSTHLAVLRHLIDLRAAFAAAERAGPPALQSAIDAMAAALRLFQHGDGGLALFNDGNEEEGWQVDMALSRADGKMKALAQAPQSGFQRLVAGRVAVVVDAGAPPRPGQDAHAHAGTLSFEMSVGRERLIVNCGAHPGDPGWRRAQRMTAAHSTLTLADTNSSVLLPEGGVLRGPMTVACRREESEGNVWLDLSHDGYAAPFGVVHRRRLYLAGSGDELRGEDRLTADGSGRNRDGRGFAVRFHLHPLAQASQAQNGMAAILRLPSGNGWRLRSTDHPVTLEESVYLGRRGEIRRTQQVVIQATTSGEDSVVKWAIGRETRRR